MAYTTIRSTTKKAVSKAYQAIEKELREDVDTDGTPVWPEKELTPDKIFEELADDLCSQFGRDVFDMHKALCSVFALGVEVGSKRAQQP